jgi:zinc transport system ATP-binding protein
MTASVFELKGVSFGYDTRLVLENVNLEAPEGGFISIIGPNGGGKSTLLKLLLGLIEPQRGTVRVFGEKPTRARGRIGYMPQYHRIDTHFPITVEEVVGLGLLTRRTRLGWPRRGDHAAVDLALETVGCPQLRKEPFAHLSGGQRQLVLIARALVSNPRLLLLDEPTANLDPAVEGSFHDLLRSLAGKITICLVSHDVGLVTEQTEQVICVNRSVVLHPARAVSGELVEAMFGVPHARMVDHSHEVEGHDHG